MDPKPIGLSPHSTVRGRPRTTSTRNDPCARCGRNIPRLAARWPEGRLCFTCYFNAMHTRGTCPRCLQDRLLPGPPKADGHPICDLRRDPLRLPLRPLRSGSRTPSWTPVRPLRPARRPPRPARRRTERPRPGWLGRCALCLRPTGVGHRLEALPQGPSPPAWSR